METATVENKENQLMNEIAFPPFKKDFLYRCEDLATEIDNKPLIYVSKRDYAFSASFNVLNDTLNGYIALPVDENEKLHKLENLFINLLIASSNIFFEIEKKSIKELTDIEYDFLSSYEKGIQVYADQI